MPKENTPSGAKSSYRCQLCDGETDPGGFAKLGHDLVKQVHGHETVAEQVGSEFLEVDIFEELGQQFIHSGGPATTAGQKAFADLSEKFAKEQILPRITDEIIEEHQEQPIGQHSDDLQRVLHYFRRQPNDGKYIIIELERSEEWGIGKLAGERGEPPEILEGGFESPEEVEHSIFRKRVSELKQKYK